MDLPRRATQNLELHIHDLNPFNPLAGKPVHLPASFVDPLGQELHQQDDSYIRTLDAPGWFFGQHHQASRRTDVTPGPICAPLLQQVQRPAEPRSDQPMRPLSNQGPCSLGLTKGPVHSA